MGKKKKGGGDKDAQWADAKKRCRLNAEEVRMAKELGFGPKALIGNIPSPSQQWKAPVKFWIRDLHAKRFGAPEAAPTDERTVADSTAAGASDDDFEFEKIWVED